MKVSLGHFFREVYADKKRPAGQEPGVSFWRSARRREHFLVVLASADKTNRILTQGFESVPRRSDTTKPAIKAGLS